MCFRMKAFGTPERGLAQVQHQKTLLYTLMRPLFCIFLTLLLFSTAACVDDKAVIVPDFTISIRLSAQAAAKLHSLHESIKVRVVFDGDGEEVPSVKTAPHRAVYLGYVEKEVNDKNIAEFKGEKVPEKDWNRLFNKDYFVTINVFSARKALPDNILFCDIIEEKIESMRDKISEVHCSLISEILR